MAFHEEYVNHKTGFNISAKDIVRPFQANGRAYFFAKIWHIMRGCKEKRKIQLHIFGGNMRFEMYFGNMIFSKTKSTISACRKITTVSA